MKKDGLEIFNDIAMLSNENRERRGYIVDYISNLRVRDTPEESQAIQPFCQILVNDYNYSKNQIVTHPQFFIKKFPSDPNGSYPIDIAIFKTPKKRKTIYTLLLNVKNRNEKKELLN